MKKIETILRNTEFESSSVKTPQFKTFASAFKTEFKKELSTVGASNFMFNVGHFYISGFFNVKGKLYYFSISDIRDCHLKNKTALLYRTAQHYQDFTGGMNQYVNIEENMAEKMDL